MIRPIYRRPVFSLLAVWAALQLACARAEEEKAVHQRKPIPAAGELRKLPPDGGPEFNRLVFEKSPYLLQHAANPVDWYPWGTEAFERARKENKPVFLSVGYTTCHWCHVMERESFEDEQVATLMNKFFVCVKVDREERPDVDKIYMDITQAMTGSGGWPMTVVMTPEAKPFFAGTYFPKTGGAGRPGMMELLPQLAGAWENDREKVLEVSERAAGAVRQMNRGAPGSALSEATLETAHEQLVLRFDATNGGFAQAPKFPVPHNLSFLLRYWKRSGDAKALEMVEKTLVHMRRGGIYDHVGFGFHRYSTDPVWLLPHFEKMLYDQALLAIAYLEAFQATGKDEYAQTAREIFTYTLRDMTSPEGGFFSAEDADSEGEEGKFYVWKVSDVRKALGDAEAGLFNKIYNVVPGGNFMDQSTRQKTGESIPHLRKSLQELAGDLEMAESELVTRLDAARLNLFAVREDRIHPQKDDKILTDWNGLMIAALARAAHVLDEPAYEQAARKAADFALATLRRPDGRLVKRYRQGEAGLPAHLEDYAFLVWGLIELYETTFDIRYLAEAVALNDLMLKHFWDESSGGLFLTADDGEQLLARGKEVYDGAIPSGNSVAALNLVRLARLTGKTEYEDRAGEIMKAFSGVVGQGASSFAMLMQALDFMVGPSYEVVLAGSVEGAREFSSTLREHYLPNKVVLHRPSDEKEAETVVALAPYARAMTSAEGTTMAYVCRNFACQLPTSDAAGMLKNLGVGKQDESGVGEDGPKSE